MTRQDHFQGLRRRVIFWFKVEKSCDEICHKVGLTKISDIKELSKNKKNLDQVLIWLNKKLV
jgi:hypothetical protein